MTRTIPLTQGKVTIVDESDYESLIACLGRFDTPENAHAAYCAAAVKYHKEFARFA